MLTLPAERLRRTAQVLQPAGRRLYGFAVPAVLVAGWLTLALTHRLLPYPSDQLHYMEAASHFPEPIPGSALTHQTTRFGLTGLTRAAMALFGYSEATYYVVPLLGGVSAARHVAIAHDVSGVAPPRPRSCSPTRRSSSTRSSCCRTCSPPGCSPSRWRSQSRYGESAYRPDPGRCSSSASCSAGSYLVREFIVFVGR